MDPHRPDGANHSDFNPTLFSHGRLLWRSPGSDGARFSPRLAWRLLDEVTRERESTALWDPFCGTGLIPSLATLFFGASFSGVYASDVSDAAASVATKNLRLVSDQDVAAQRKREVHGRRGQNPKSDLRWGEVERYLDVLEPHIALAASRALPLHCWTGPAHRLPDIGSELCIVADSPYGTQSRLAGAALEDVVASWLADERVARVALVMAEPLAVVHARPGMRVTQEPVRGGRTVLHASHASAFRATE